MSRRTRIGKVGREGSRGLCSRVRQRLSRKGRAVRQRAQSRSATRQVRELAIADARSERVRVNAIGRIVSRAFVRSPGVSRAPRCWWNPADSLFKSDFSAAVSPFSVNVPLKTDIAESWETAIRCSAAGQRFLQFAPLAVRECADAKTAREIIRVTFHSNAREEPCMRGELSPGRPKRRLLHYLREWHRTLSAAMTRHTRSGDRRITALGIVSSRRLTSCTIRINLPCDQLVALRVTREVELSEWLPFAAHVTELTANSERAG